MKNIYICLLHAGRPTMEMNGTTDPADQQASILIVDKMCSCKMTDQSEDNLCQFC